MPLRTPPAGAAGAAGSAASAPVPFWLIWSGHPGLMATLGDRIPDRNIRIREVETVRFCFYFDQVNMTKRLQSDIVVG